MYLVAVESHLVAAKKARIGLVAVADEVEQNHLRAEQRKYYKDKVDLLELFLARKIRPQ